MGIRYELHPKTKRKKSSSCEVTLINIKQFYKKIKIFNKKLWEAIVADFVIVMYQR